MLSPGTTESPRTGQGFFVVRRLTLCAPRFAPCPPLRLDRVGSIDQPNHGVTGEIVDNI